LRNKTLFINKSDSFCGGCGQNADPSEVSHETVFGGGLRTQVRKGCGVVYEYVASEYRGGGIEDAVRNMRPDLKWSEAL
jgi:hypothetical protein